MYGWLGNYNQEFVNGGELMTSGHPSSIDYISLKHLRDNIEQVMTADDNLTFTANLVLSTEPENPSMCTELPQAVSTREESTKSSCGGDETQVLIWIMFGVLSSITLILLILLICTCKQLRKTKAKQSK